MHAAVVAADAATHEGAALSLASRMISDTTCRVTCATSVMYRVLFMPSSSCKSLSNLYTVGAGYQSVVTNMSPLPLTGANQFLQSLSLTIPHVIWAWAAAAAPKLRPAVAAPVSPGKGSGAAGGAYVDGGLPVCGGGTGEGSSGGDGGGVGERVAAAGVFNPPPSPPSSSRAGTAEFASCIAEYGSEGFTHAPKPEARASAPAAVPARAARRRGG
jgi:hypothetical protein